MPHKYLEKYSNFGDYFHLSGRLKETEHELEVAIVKTDSEDDWARWGRSLYSIAHCAHEDSEQDAEDEDDSDSDSDLQVLADVVSTL